MSDKRYEAWDGKSYPWPPPNGWYLADDEKWWPEGYGPKGGEQRAASEAGRNDSSSRNSNNSKGSNTDSGGSFSSAATGAGVAAGAAGAGVATGSATGGQGTNGGPTTTQNESRQQLSLIHI